LKIIHDEIKSMQALIDANDKKMTKDFEYWYEIMLKKYEWESKNGKIDQLNTDSSKINNFLSSNTMNSSNFNNTSSLSQITERINKSKEMIMNDASLLKN
jgi:hypothetical protein